MLNGLTPTSGTVQQGVGSGILVVALTGFTSGSTRQIFDMGGSTGLILSPVSSTATGEQIWTGFENLTVGTFDLTVRETLAGESNSPRDTIITVTVTPATLNDIIWTTPTIADTTGVGSQVGYLTNGRTNGSTLELTENDGGRFAIDNTGRVTVAASLIGYSGARFIRVRETLAGATNSPKSTLAQVNVTAPTLQNLTLTPATVGHKAAIGSVVGTINGRTSDASLNFSDPSGLFTLGSGTITTTADLSNRIGQSFNITVTETRAGADGSPKTSVITITVVEGYSGPQWRSVGTVASSTASVTPGIPAGTSADDFLLLICETAAQSVTAPSGWSVIPAQTTGTAASTTATGPYSFYKIASAGETAPTIADPGDHIIARIHRFDPAVLDAAFAGSVQSSASTAVTIPSITTTTGHCLVVGMLSVATDIATSRVSTMSNANLTNVTKRSDDATTQGNGGGISLFTGELVTAGPTGTWSGTIATSSLQGRVAVALRRPGPTVVVTKTGAGTTVAPTGATGVVAELHGAGRGGYLFQGGDGGDWITKTLPAVAGQEFSYSVGAGSAGSYAGPTSNGGDTWFGSASTALAKGGGSSSSSVGDTVNAGGLGGFDNSGASAYVGGGGAGHSAGSGGNASTVSVTGGSSGTRSGGAGGGDPGTSHPDGGGGGAGGFSSVGGLGGAPGGGGGRTSGGGTSSLLGGSGARGQLKYTWVFTAPPASIDGSLTRTLSPVTVSSTVSIQSASATANLSRTFGAMTSTGATTVLVTGRATNALAPTTSTAAVSATVQGSLARALGGLSSSSVVQVQVTAQANRSLNPATSVSQTSVLATGSTSAQLAPATVTATGGPQVSGGLTATLAPISRNIIAGVVVQARVNASLEAATLISNVTGAPAAGLIATLGQATATASATVEITGAATPSLAPTSVAATGTSTVTADASASLSPATVQAQATAQATAMVNRALDGLQAVSQATSTITGSVSATLAPVSVTASSGSSTGANLTATLAPTSAQSTGVVRIGGAIIAGLGPMIGEATGVVPLAANSNNALGDLTGASNVITPIFGRATATLEPMSAQAVAYVVIDATTGAQLGSLVLSSEATARLFGILEIDPTRVVVIPADARSVVIPADTRLILIPEDSRAVVVTADDRVVQVPSDPRTAA
ncbi:hypothetical protein [uncultured Brevundimonas sp.]|uniref:beta strand repeat-containing protein n=1 Tax=uncultured Brevundimonas sp. TaxID=213418 RepID=UPI0025CC5F45|nr:hypothetical protein [uncultured Brevundimonas sp.]